MNGLSRQIPDLEVKSFIKVASHVEAAKFTESNGQLIINWITANGGKASRINKGTCLLIEVHTNEKVMEAYYHDWVVYEPYTQDKPFYVSKSIIFDQAYQEVAKGVLNVNDKANSINDYRSLPIGTLVAGIDSIPFVKVEQDQWQGMTVGVQTMIYCITDQQMARDVRTVLKKS